MTGSLDRRAVLAGAAGLGLGAAAWPGRAAAADGLLVDVQLDDAALLEHFIKLRQSLDDRVTIGWVDAVNYAFVDGATFPLYRLLAATWRRTWRPEPGGPRRTASTEVAFFLDMRTGEPLERLTMPVTGRTVDVPLYRAGPTTDDVVARFDVDEPFRMKQETRDGDAFFVAGRSLREGFLSQPQRRGDDFFVRQDIGTRVLAADDGPPIFFYREWTVSRGSWAALNDPALKLVPCELAYFATAAWRPWMQMQGVPGHTLQNGLGGRVESVDALPAEIQRLARRHHPDLVDAPLDALGKA